MAVPRDAPSATDAALHETLPLVAAERRWAFVDVLSVKTGLAIATWAFLFGGATAQLVGFVDGLFAILIGNAIGVIILLIAMMSSSAKWGSEWFVSQRSVFGPRGVIAYVIVFVLIAVFFWAAILASMTGNALTDIVVQLGIGLPLEREWLVKLVALAVLALTWALVARGSGSIRILNLLAAPALVLMCLWLMASIFGQFSLAQIMAAPPIAPPADRGMNLMLAVELNIASGLGWNSLACNLGRYAKSPRAAIWGSFVAYVPVNGLAAGVGLTSALVLGSADPVTWMVPIVGPAGGLILLVVLALANLSSLVGMLQGNCQTLVQNLGPRLQSLGWPLFTLLVTVGVAGLVVLGSETLFSRFSTLVSFLQAILVSAAGVALADYMLLRRRNLCLRALYDNRPGSDYAFWGGVNPFPFVAIAAGALVYLLLLDPVTFEAAPLFRLASASLPALVVALFSHLLLTRLFVIPAGKGGYGPPTKQSIYRDL